MSLYTQLKIGYNLNAIAELQIEKSGRHYIGVDTIVDLPDSMVDIPDTLHDTLTSGEFGKLLLPSHGALRGLRQGLFLPR